MAIALSHGGTTIYSSPSPSDEVLVGTTEGVVILGRQSSGWEVVHRSLPDAHISSIIMPPESGLIFAGVFHGGIHASSDGGRTWERRDEGLTQEDVFSLAWVRTDDNVRLYAGTEPAHLFFSDDLGLGWTELPALRSVPSVSKWNFPAPPHVGHVKHINFLPGDPATVFAGIEQGGLLKSTDAGQTWSEVHGVDEDIHRVMVHPFDTQRIYTVTGAGTYVTSDGGATWEHRLDREHEVGGYPDQLVFHPRNPDLMFLSAAHHNPGAWRESHFAGSRISRSMDGGKTWQVLRNGLPDRLQSSVEAMCLEEWGDSAAVFAATTAGEVYCTEDGGEHWSLIVHGLAPVSKGGHFRPLVQAPA